jgi:hypothetical protein
MAVGLANMLGGPCWHAELPPVDIIPRVQGGTSSLPVLHNKLASLFLAAPAVMQLHS